MFTWNLQYISKSRLSDTLKQLMIDSAKGDILIRIHTAIHNADEAVDLASYIKSIVPGAHIIGTSTSAVIHEGKLHMDQCLISVTQMSGSSLKSIRMELPKSESGKESASKLCSEVKDALIGSDKCFMFVFFTEGYRDIKRFVDSSNELMPGTQLIGGVAGGRELVGSDLTNNGFVFDENGWSDNAVIAASISGEELGYLSSVVTGVQVVGEELAITDCNGRMILGIDGIPSPEKYREGIGEEIRTRPELAFHFPLVYSQHKDVPFLFGYSEEGLQTNHNIDVGDKLKRGFIYDRKIVSDNRSTFNKFEAFNKAETIFGYSCRDRSRFYPNSVMWELSIYENSNISGCLTEGEIGCVDNMNIFTNCAFVISAAGEGDSFQRFNPYVFFNTESLEADNNKLIGYLMDIERVYRSESAMASSLRDFIKSCELKLLYSENESVLNEAALNMDMEINGFDRVCIIEVLDVQRMRMVFTEKMIEATHKRFVSKCLSFVSGKDYHVYQLDKWKLAIAAPSYIVSLQTFSEAMKKLQKELFETTDQYIAIVPIFCVINGCMVDNIDTVYNSARLEMMHKNIQFYVSNAGSEEIDEQNIRDIYHIVSVINYALSHDKVIPYFQGIYDNKAKAIHHYEALIRLEDENGKVYYPGQFLDVARSFGLLYDELSKAMIRKVFARFSDNENSCVSINIGMRDIKNEDITNYIYGFLATARYPGNFIFEILENEDVEDYDLLIRFVNTIHKLGAYISVDDFGSGYSNLQHLASIHYDYLKIDGSIVKNCHKDQESENLIAMISDWRNRSFRDARIVAEYVENEDIQSKLEKYEIDFSQGYLFSVPSPDLPSDK